MIPLRDRSSRPPTRSHQGLACSAVFCDLSGQGRPMQVAGRPLAGDFAWVANALPAALSPGAARIMSFPEIGSVSTRVRRGETADRRPPTRSRLANRISCTAQMTKEGESRLSATDRASQREKPPHLASVRPRGIGRRATVLLRVARLALTLAVRLAQLAFSPIHQPLTTIPSFRQLIDWQ